jgi:hypothetical protein
MVELAVVAIRTVTLFAWDGSRASGEPSPRRHATKPGGFAPYAPSCADFGRFTSMAFVDLYAWYFDPMAFAELIADLDTLGQIPFHLESTSPTRGHEIEFFAVLAAN